MKTSAQAQKANVLYCIPAHLVYIYLVKNSFQVIIMSVVILGRHPDQLRLPDAAQQIGRQDFQRSHAVPGLPLHPGRLQLAGARLDRAEVFPKPPEADLGPGPGQGGALHQQLQGLVRRVVALTRALVSKCRSVSLRVRALALLL